MTFWSPWQLGKKSWWSRWSITYLEIFVFGTSWYLCKSCPLCLRAQPLRWFPCGARAVKFVRTRLFIGCSYCHHMVVLWGSWDLDIQVLETSLFHFYMYPGQGGNWPPRPLALIGQGVVVECWKSKPGDQWKFCLFFLFLSRPLTKEKGQRWTPTQLKERTWRLMFRLCRPVAVDRKWTTWRRAELGCRGGDGCLLSTLEVGWMAKHAEASEAVLQARVPDKLCYLPVGHSQWMQRLDCHWLFILILFLMGIDVLGHARGDSDILPDCYACNSAGDSKSHHAALHRHRFMAFCTTLHLAKDPSSGIGRWNYQVRVQEVLWCFHPDVMRFC